MLEKPEKKFGSKLVLQIFFAFSNFGGFCWFRGLLQGPGPSRPRKRPKTPQNTKKRVLVITLARGGVTGRSTPPFPCTMGVPDRFRRVRDPSGTILTTFGLPAGPAGPARARKCFRSGSRGSRKKIFPERIFLFKNDIHWVLSGFRAQKTHFGPL